MNGFAKKPALTQARVPCKNWRIADATVFIVPERLNFFIGRDQLNQLGIAIFKPSHPIESNTTN